MDYCFSCQFMPNNRCLHTKGRNAATPTTPADGCSYFTPATPKAQPTPPADALTAADRELLRHLEALAMPDPWQLKRLNELRAQAGIELCSYWHCRKPVRVVGRDRVCECGNTWRVEA